MYNKYNIVSKIGTILSFFLLGFDSITDLFKDKAIYFYVNIPIKYIPYVILTIIFCGIFWCLRYCWKYYKSNDIDLSFDAIGDKKQTIILKLFNNSNHNIEVQSINFFCVSPGLIDIKIIIPSLTCYTMGGVTKMPKLSITTFGMKIGSPEYNKIKKKYKHSILYITYKFLNNDTTFGIGRKLSTKEIKMFKKLSEQK